jgi:hypothetical protein
MADLNLHPGLATFGFLGLGGTFLGLAVLLGGTAFLRPRWTLLGPAALAALAAALALLGLGTGSWLSPLALAAVWAGWHAVHAPPDGRVAAALACLRRPAWQGAALLAVSTGGVVVAVCGGESDGLERVVEHSMGWEALVEKYGLRALPPGQVATDRGRPVRAYTQAGATPLGEEILAREEAALSPQFQTTGVVRLAPPSGVCNCHGWVFTGGRYWMRGADVSVILEDNGYEAVSAPQSGDLVVYRDGQGRITHTGMVLAVAEGGTTVVESKWGDLGLYLHPAEFLRYGTPHFYRSPRTGHQLHGVDGPSGTDSAEHRSRSARLPNPR